MLAKKPYTECPYESMVRLGAPWIDEWTELIVKVLTAYENGIRNEADFDGQAELSNEDFLYERFKDNVESNMLFANWQVLKYFYAIMRMKMYKEAIGEWTFTEHDVEMYRYFANLSVSDDMKAKAKHFKFQFDNLFRWKSDIIDEDQVVSGELISENGFTHHKFVYCFTDNYRSYTSASFATLLQQKSSQIDLMLYRAKKLTCCTYFDEYMVKFNPRIDYFSCSKQWPIAGEFYSDPEYQDFSSITDINFLGR